MWEKYIFALLLCKEKYCSSVSLITRSVTFSQHLRILSSARMQTNPRNWHNFVLSIFAKLSNKFCTNRVWKISFRSKIAFNIAIVQFGQCEKKRLTYHFPYRRTMGNVNSYKFSMWKIKSFVPLAGRALRNKLPHVNCDVNENVSIRQLSYLLGSSASFCSIVKYMWWLLELRGCWAWAFSYLGAKCIFWTHNERNHSNSSCLNIYRDFVFVPSNKLFHDIHFNSRLLQVFLFFIVIIKCKHEYSLYAKIIIIIYRKRMLSYLMIFKFWYLHILVSFFE